MFVSRPSRASLGIFAAANTSLCGNGKQRICQLRERHTQQVEFIFRQLTGQRVGDSRDGSRQFTCIHKNATSTLLYETPAGACIPSALFTALFVEHKVQIPVAHR